MAAALEKGISKPKIELYSGKYFLACGIGGMAACGPTHTAVTPLDLVKTLRQIQPKLYTSNTSAWRSIYRSSGIRGIFFGWSPTFVGYALQGGGKYGFYEVFKYLYGEKLAPNANRTLVYASASATAEFFADIALCPFESVKVRMQTSNPPFANSLREGLRKVVREEGVAGLYKGIAPLWARQIPYTVVKFSTFERTISLIYTSLPSPKESYSGIQQTLISLLGGYIAGIGCAIISHPADIMVSKLNTQKKAHEGTMSAVKRIYNDIGFRGVWNGLPTRILMIGTLTGMQFFVYDGFKVLLGLPTTGGH